MSTTNGTDTPVLVSRPEEGITQITLNRPERLNAMNAGLVDGLHAALDAVAVDPDCRVVVLTGAGRGFCAGLDLFGYGGKPATGRGRGRGQDTFDTQTRIAGLVPKLRSLGQPVIAAVNGAAAGGGLALTLASDIRIASRSAKFNVAFVRIGLSGCDVGVSWMLPRLIGASRAWELMLTGRVILADEADDIGLLTKLVDDDALLESAYETARLIIANSQWGVRMTKEVMWSQLEIASLQAGIDIENRTQVLSSLVNNQSDSRSWFTGKHNRQGAPS